MSDVRGAAQELDVVAVLGHEHARLDVGEHVSGTLTARKTHLVCLVGDGRPDRCGYLRSKGSACANMYCIYYIYSGVEVKGEGE